MLIKMVVKLSKLLSKTPRKIIYVTKSTKDNAAHKDNAGCLWKIINRSIPTKERSTQVYSKPTVQIANDFNQ
jgi:hypothetical protein